MLARHDTFTVLDFETTGIVQDYPSEPWQIGLIQVKKGRLMVRKKYNKLLYVGDRPFNLYAPGRHQELLPRIRRSKTLLEHWPKLQEYLHNQTLVAHNAATERKVLRTAFPMHSFGPWVDTLTLTRIAYPTLPSHKLEDLVYYLNLQERINEFCPDLEAHDAYYDAVACAAVLEKLLKIESWKKVTTAALIQAKAGARRKT